MSASTVSGTIQDPSGQIFANGTWQLVFKPTPNTPGLFTDAGVPFTTLFGGVLDNTGSFSQAGVARNDTIAPAKSLWTLIVSPNANGQAYSVDLNVNSGAFNASAAINAVITNIVVSATSLAHAYKDSEVLLTPNSGAQYYDSTLKALKIWDTALAAWQTLTPNGGNPNFPTATIGVLTATTINNSGVFSTKIFDTIRMCANAAFANTAACQTDAGSTGGMLFAPNYSIGAFTNSNNRPVLDFTRVDWRGFVNVKDFGAKGDGATDDTVAIQAAINFACTGSSSTTPTGNNCPSWIAGTAQGGTVYLPAGQYKITAPIVLYGQINLHGSGKLSTIISKANNANGTITSITAGTGVGRSPTACGGGPCVDSFANDAIIQIPYISSGNTDYAYRWEIRDIGLFGSGTNGTKYGIYAPRSAQSSIKNVYIFMNCSQGAPANCGSVQGNGFYTEDSWLMRHEGVTVDSSWIGWNHVNDGSGLGSGTSAIFSDDWGVNIGCSGFHLFGLSYSNMNANAIDHFNKKGTDIVASDGTCYPYSFNSTSGMSINGGGAEDVIGGIMWANASSVTISGGFKTFGQAGQTSAGTLATLFIDGGSAVTMNGTLFSAVTSPGNIFNIVLQNGSFLNDTNSTLPTGGNGFIGYSSGSAKCDFNSGVLICTNSSGNSSFDSNKYSFGETTVPAGVIGKALVWADSADHFLKYNPNNAGEQHIPQVYRLTAQYTNSTTGFTTVGTPNIAFSVKASTNYTATCHLYYQAAATGGLNIQFTGPAAPTSVIYGLDDPSTATTFNSSVATAFSTSLGQVIGTAATNFDAIVSFSLINGANAGTVTLQAKSSAAVQLQIQSGSYCVIQ